MSYTYTLEPVFFFSLLPLQTIDCKFYDQINHLYSLFASYRFEIDCKDSLKDNLANILTLLM